MAVQQNKKSPSKRGMHRSHNALAVPGIALEPTTGETHLRHHMFKAVAGIEPQQRPSGSGEQMGIGQLHHMNG